MQRFVSLLSALAIYAFLGTVLTTSGCKEPMKEQPKIPGTAKKDLKFDKSMLEVKAGEAVTVKAAKDSVKITGAKLAKSDVKGLTVSHDATSVTVTAAKDAAAAKNVEINVTGEEKKTATLKVTVTAAAVAVIPPPVIPPPTAVAKDLKFNTMAQSVMPGKDVMFNVLDGVVAGTPEAPKDSMLTVTCPKANCVKVVADAKAKPGTYQIVVKGQGDKTAKLTVTVPAAVTPAAAKELKFEKTSLEVKAGEEATFKAAAHSAKITKADLAKADPKLTVTNTATSVTLKADKAAAAAKDVEVKVTGEGDKKATLKITVVAALPLPPPSQPTELKFKKDATTQDVKQGDKYVFMASSESVKITGAKLAKSDVKGLKVTNDDKSVTVEVAADAAVADGIEISVTGAGNKTATLKVNVKKK